MSETYEAILNHLLFHKALISEENGGEKISSYMNMVQEIEQGHYIAVRDPFEKSIAAAFELVLEKQMNPWDINLAEFTKMYMEKVKDDGYVNFVTAGKLVFMAWSILKMQSDEVLTAAEPPGEEFLFADWDLNLGFYEDAGDIDYNQIVLKGETKPLQEAIRRPGKRAVTLIELMSAFDEAKEEAERHLELMALRERASNIRAVIPRRNIHSDDLMEDLSSTWSRISEFDGAPIPLVDIYDGDIWDRITVFTSILFLANLQKIKIWQKKLPYGEILIQRLVEEDELTTEELSAITGTKSQSGVKAGVVS